MSNWLLARATLTKNALVDDVFLASSVLTDGDLGNTFMDFFTAAPLMRQQTT